MNLSNSNIYKFFNDQEYKDKWMFLLDYLRSVDGTTHTTRQIDAIKGNGTNVDYPLYLANHLSYSIINFFTETHVVGGYTSINFTTTSLYDTLIAYNNQIIVNLNNYKLFNITDEI